MTAVKSTRVAYFLICLSLLICAFGCHPGGVSFDPAKAYSKGLGFCYPGLQWGMTVQEVEDALGVSLGDATYGSEGNGVDYRTSETYDSAYFEADTNFSWQGMEKGYSMFQFRNGKLWAANVTFPAERTKEEFEALSELLTEAYGLTPALEENTLPAEEASRSEDVKMTDYRWVLTGSDGVETRAVLSGTDSGGGIVVTLNFSEYPIQY